MKNKYHQIITLLLPGMIYFQSVYRTARSIPTIQEWNDFIDTKTQEKQVDRGSFIVLNSMTLYHPD